MLKIEHISKRLGKEQILKDVSFEVAPGEVFGFLGPNGAGKTTTIRIITGLLEQDEGKVTVNGHDVVEERSKALTQIGAIVENPAFYPYMTGKQNLVHAKNLIPGLGEVDYEALSRLVGLEGKLSKKVGEYSLGMKQRLGIARALLHNPRVLILDEPTNGLDPAGIAELREYLRAMARDQQIAILISSHMLGEMEQISDRYAIIDQGVIKSVESVRNETGSKILLRVATEETEDVLKALKAANYQADLWNDRIVVTAPETACPAIARLVVPIADLHELTIKRMTLEEQFLQVTKKEGDSHAFTHTK
ncbi:MULTISPECIES: ABC transporter ATP-binding protein [unclassified Exiguobacterium]|uniref:ABC transporter ATP-binding protein n=1 Tax=unclassified Exiguobacterium TaxID=2644629 RepID=UPI000B58C119|nr:MULTISPECIES: ABC transporter ATP-binding protein [unclassified Exiguobacterium]ASI34681.1 ABC transporter [Exiguobacterium sp. N4-1P]